MRYFLYIVGIIRFCYFVIFSSHRNTSILQSYTSVFSIIVERLSLIRGYKHNWPEHIKTLVHLYIDFFIYAFLNSYSYVSKLPGFITSIITLFSTRLSYQNLSRQGSRLTKFPQFYKC